MVRMRRLADWESSILYLLYLYSRTLRTHIDDLQAAILTNTRSARGLGRRRQRINSVVRNKITPEPVSLKSRPAIFTPQNTYCGASGEYRGPSMAVWKPEYLEWGFEGVFN